MHFTKLPYDKFVERVAELLSATLNDPAIVTATGRFGYDKNKIKTGDRILKDLQKIDTKQISALQRKVKLHEERGKLNLFVRKKYMKILQIARIAFDDDIIIKKSLQLEGAREKSLDLWINQVSIFANHLISEPNWMSVLKKYGIERKELYALMTDLDKLRSASMTCEQAKTEAKKLTQQKKLKIKELQNWISDFLKIAKIALEENPELYKKLREE
jgi:hypothetical protein